MNVTWPPFAGWLLHSALGGGMLLLLALPLMRACRQPARRQRLGESALLAALVLCILNLGPSWITLPLPTTEPSLPLVTAREREVSEEERENNDSPMLDDTAASLMLSLLEAPSPNVDPAPGNSSGEIADAGSATADSTPGISSALASLNVSRWLP